MKYYYPPVFCPLHTPPKVQTPCPVWTLFLCPNAKTLMTKFCKSLPCSCCWDLLAEPFRLRDTKPRPVNRLVSCVFGKEVIYDY